MDTERIRRDVFSFSTLTFFLKKEENYAKPSAQTVRIRAEHQTRNVSETTQ
jgi:hypothetical protein